MKELSIEEKARLYDEAIKKVNDFYEGKTKLYSDVDKTLNYLFPELKESEDERIRKDIISFLRSKNGYMNPNEDWDFRNRWLPWLEKHGEQKVSVVEFNAKDWYVSKVDGKIYNAKFMKKASTNLARKLEIEKAAMSATGIIDREEWFIKGAEWADGNPSYISSEKQGEQKPTDIVEPKFKVGDEIIRSSKSSCPVHSSTDDTICKVAEIHDTCYILDTKDGKIQAPFKWQDYYELIEQKPDEWKQENVEELTEFENAMMHIGGSFFGENAGLDPNDTDVIKEQANILLGLVPSKEWSEEDVAMLDSTIAFVSHSPFTVIGKGKSNVISWLKSLKDKIQPKQEWSAEDKRNFLDVTCIIDEVWSNQKVREEIDHSNEELESLWHWLYNIWQRVKYPQDTWKPSDEQIDALYTYIYNPQYFNSPDPRMELVESLYNDLKKLKG